MNIVKVNEVISCGKVVTYNIEMAGKWCQLFNLQKEMCVEYSLNISLVPKSVLVIPYVCNILPIVWLCDAHLYLDEIDQDFYENIDKIKRGYQNMYPMLAFKGNIYAARFEDNRPERALSRVAMFFSGGVDAYTTLFRHMEEKPILVTLWGADIKLSDQNGWENTLAGKQEAAHKFELEYITVKSNFREIINEAKLDVIVRRTGDGWWHGLQHGIAIISHMAPVAYIKNLSSAYIASSFPESMKGKYTCASDPSIDNYVRYCGCETIHDGYEFDRQGKGRYIIRYAEQHRKSIKLRTCWEKSGGQNCCKCEKCYRTILELVSEGADPNEYGYKWDRRAINTCKRDMRYKITLQVYNVDQFYPPIQQAMRANREKIKEYDMYKWLLRMDFSQFNDFPVKRLRYSNIGRITRRIRKISK